MACLKLKVKQGEEKSIGFTIKQNDEPMSLANLTVHFQVKLDPTVSSNAIINKYITTSSDINKDGQVTDAMNGVFQVHLDEKDTSFPIGDYYLIISLEEYDGDDVTYCNIISSNCCNNAIYKICEQ